MALGGLGGSAATVFVDVEGDLTKFRQDVKGAGQIAGKELGGMGSKVAKRAGLAVAGAAAAGLAGSAKVFVDFERGMNEVFTLIPDAGQGAFDDLTGQTKEFAKEFGVLPTDVIPALYDSLSAGVPQDNVFAFLEDANKFAKAGAVDLGTAVDGLTSTVNAYGLGAEGAGRVSDSLFTAVKLGKTTVEELSGSMFQVAPIAASFGVSVEDVAAGFATLTAQGTPTSVAATQMKGAISELGKEGTKASDAFKDITGQTFPDFIAGGGTLVEAADLMSTGAEDLGLSVVDLFGSIEAGQAFVGLSADVEGATATLEAVRDSAGSTDVAFEQMEKGVGPTLDKLKARFSVVAIELGTALAPSLEAVAGIALTFAEALNTLPGPVLAIIVGAVGLGGGLLALSGPILRTTKLVKGLFTLLSANPYIILIAATVAIAILIYKNWDEISAFLLEAWEGIKAALSDAWNWIKETTDRIWNAIKDFFSTWWPLILGIMTGGIGLVIGLIIKNWDEIKAKTEEIWNAITGFLVGIWDGFVRFVQEKFTSIKTKIEEVWNTVKTITETIWNGIKATVDTVVTGITILITTQMNAAKAVVDTVWNGIKTIIESVTSAGSLAVDGFLATIRNFWEGLQTLQNVATGVFDTLKSVIGSAVDFLIGKINALKDAAANALGPLGDVAGFAGKGLGAVTGGVGKVGGFLGFDDGGIVPGPTGAPRLVLAHAGETILPTHKDGGGSGSGITIQMSVSSEVRDPAFFERQATEIARVVKREVGRTDRGRGLR